MPGIHSGKATIKDFYNELIRRKVIRVVFFYVLVGWGLIEGASLLEEVLELPGWTDRLVLVLVGLGLPLTVVLAWIFDITPGGIERTTEFESNQESVDNPSGTENPIPGIDDAVASICVLPFDDLSPETDHVWMAEGLSSEIHSTLDRMHRVRVASRRSSAHFRGSDRSVQDIGRALHARYVLSGSLTCMGDRIRVNAGLDDAESGSQIWSERYERSIDDLLAVQADIAEKIVSAFGVERQRLEITGAFKSPTDNLDAWGTVQRARHYILDYSQESLDEAKKLLKRAIDLDADYAAAHAAFGSVLVERVLNGFCNDINEDLKQALSAATRAQQLAPQDPFVLKMSGMVLAAYGHVEDSIRSLRACVELAPYDFGAWGYLGWPLSARGNNSDFEEIHEIMDRLLKSASDHPGNDYWQYHKSVAFQCQGELDAARDLMQNALKKHSAPAWAWMQLASICASAGVYEKAKEASDKAMDINDKLTPAHFARCIRRMCVNGQLADARLGGLVAAGLLDDQRSKSI